MARPVKNNFHHFKYINISVDEELFKKLRSSAKRYACTLPDVVRGILEAEYRAKPNVPQVDLAPIPVPAPITVTAKPRKITKLPKLPKAKTIKPIPDYMITHTPDDPRILAQDAMLQGHHAKHLERMRAIAAKMKKV